MVYRPNALMVLLAALSFLSLSGCVGIGWPTPEFGLVSGKGMISDGAIERLSGSQTTLDRVLLSLGVPSRTIEQNEAILVYEWHTNQNFGVVAAAGVVPIVPYMINAGGAVAGGGYGVASHIVLIEFDESRTLARLDHIKFHDAFILPEEDIMHWARGASLCSSVFENDIRAYCLHRFRKKD